MANDAQERAIVEGVLGAPDHIQFAVLQALGHEACERDRREYGEETVEADSKARLGLETDAMLHKQRADAYAHKLAEDHEMLRESAVEARNRGQDLDALARDVEALMAYYGDHGRL